MKFARPTQRRKSPFGLSGNRSVIIVALVVMLLLAVLVGRQLGVSLLGPPQSRLPGPPVERDDDPGDVRATFLVEDDPEANVSVAMMDRLPEQDRRRLAELFDQLAAADPMPEPQLLSQRSVSVTKLIYVSKRLLGTDVVVDGNVLGNQRLNVPEMPDTELRQVLLVQKQTASTWVMVAPAEQAEKLRRGDLVRAHGRFFKLRRLDKNAPPEKSEPVVVSVQLKRFAPTPAVPSASPVVTVVVLVLGVVVVVVVLVARQRSARRSPVDWSTMLSDRLADDPAFFEDNVPPPADVDERKDDTT